MVKAIDIHTHYMPQSYLELISNNSSKYMAEIVEENTVKKYINFEGGFIHPLNTSFLDINSRIEYMDKNNIKMQVLSVSPRLFYFYAPPKIGHEIASTCNDEIKAIVDRNSDRFLGMATVPLQDVNLAIKELRRVKDLGFKAIQIGSEVNDLKLADPYFLPFFEEAEKNNIFLFIHPLALGKLKFMEEYYLNNIIGHPFYTTLSVSNLVLSGIFDKLPNLKIGLSHAGGLLPYQLGRLEHGFNVRNETSSNMKQNPTYYFRKNIYYDSITHSKESLQFLIDLVGVDRIMMGSDYPFDMSVANPVSTIKELELNLLDEEKVLFGNALEIFN